MRDTLYYFVMVPMVYLAAAVFVAGLIFKFMNVMFSPRIKGRLGLFPRRLPRTAGVLKDAFALPPAFRKDKVFWAFIIAFHVAFALLALGHLELIREFAFLQIISHQVFLGAGAVGIVLIAATLYFLFRRFRTPWREISVPEDFILLLVLFVTMIFGSHMHLAARYGIAGFDIPRGLPRYLGGLVSFKPVIPDMIANSRITSYNRDPHILCETSSSCCFPSKQMIHSVF